MQKLSLVFLGFRAADDEGIVQCNLRCVSGRCKIEPGDDKGILEEPTCSGSGACVQEWRRRRGRNDGRELVNRRVGIMVVSFLGKGCGSGWSSAGSPLGH